MELVGSKAREEDSDDDLFEQIGSQEAPKPKDVDESKHNPVVDVDVEALPTETEDHVSSGNTHRMLQNWDSDLQHANVDDEEEGLNNTFPQPL